MKLHKLRFKGESTASVLLEGTLRSYANIILCRNPLVGALLMAATLFDLRLCLLGLTATIAANVFALGVNLARESVREGMMGYNALLVGIALPSFFQVSNTLLMMLFVAVILTVIINAAMTALFHYTFGLPVLTLPFLAVIYMMLLAAPYVRGLSKYTAHRGEQVMISWSTLFSGYFKALGALFFQPSVQAGLVVFIALVVFSRYGALLTFIGFTVAVWSAESMFVFPVEYVHTYIGFNFSMTALALGGIWFVPSLSALLLAVLGAVVCAFIGGSLLPLLTPFSLSILILPFNVTVLLFLYGMRQRVRDKSPKSVDFIAGTPEENVTYYRRRLARFGSYFFLDLGLPFQGSWRVTQGVDGEETHKGPWRFAWDFEVSDLTGRLFKGQGRKIEDYFCYKLPVTACADGSVVRIINDVPDNEVGQINLSQNWGNVVILYHAPGIYSVVAHLSPNSITVHEGQHVTKGMVIGLCGNSGRSPVPHLHFQIQSSPRLGSPTLAMEFKECVLLGDKGEKLHSRYIPKKGDLVRSIKADAKMAQQFTFISGKEYLWEVETEGGTHIERIVADIDVYGTMTLKSLDYKGILYYEANGRIFTVHDYLGSPQSILALFAIALIRLPYEANPRLKWSDRLIRSLKSPPLVLKFLFDITNPFVPDRGAHIDFHFSLGGEIVVKGISDSLECEVIINRHQGLKSIWVRQGDREARGRLVAPEQQSMTTNKHPAFKASNSQSSLPREWSS